MALIRIAGPIVEPVTVADVKSHLNIDYDDHDTKIEAFIKAARLKLEKRCGRAFVEQTWELRLEAFEDQIDLPLRPVMELGSVTYIDEDGATQTVDTAEYVFIDGGEDGASSVFLTGDWPTDVYERPDAVRIQFTVGYADDGESPSDPASGVPDDLKQAMFWLVGHMLENKESVVLTPSRQEFQEVPDSVAAIIAPYIVPRL